MNELTVEYDAGEPSLGDDLAAYVRFHGANAVIDALLTVAAEAYGNCEGAVSKVHELLDLRAARVTPSEMG